MPYRTVAENPKRVPNVWVLRAKRLSIALTAPVWLPLYILAVESGVLAWVWTGDPDAWKSGSSHKLVKGNDE